MARTPPLSILLVEDHADTATVLYLALTRLGHTVHVATTCAQARDIAQAIPGLQVLIADIGLPDGSGYELGESILKPRGAVGIVISGYGMLEDQRRSTEMGFMTHLVKPISLSVLESAIVQAGEAWESLATLRHSGVSGARRIRA
jgi:CheY-like chemotaxis protein